MNGAHGSGRNSDDRGDFVVSRSTVSDGATHGVSREDRAGGIEGLAGGELRDKGFSAGFGARKGERALGTAVAGQVRDEHAEILLGEAAREVGHYFFIGGEAVKEHDRTRGVIATEVDHVGDESATAGVNQDGGLSIATHTSGEKTSDTQEDSQSCANTFADLHEAVRRVEARDLVA